ncbi:polysaccharide pyruvyl transferase family protein [Kineosporia sp. J2-2]|uniref:Polysaccharide pyruvyl transferase family protein n=1 Tax=Kineosporia corallincola TaxID=2835133 RepID=A0ABS5TLY1_9ACTN|nr:polysaccharide pyruvyl transferase family protein [Kineosporia corallincola]MBT0771058.1 polysaccharide pyruvyl transferase family protein [Kineosporia corallincola]
MSARPGDDLRQDLPVVRAGQEPPVVHEPTERAGRLNRLRQEGRFAEAARSAREVTQATASAVEHLEAGLSLAAVSDYDAANAHLLLASADDEQAVTALATLAEVAWIRHDHVRGREYATDGLRLDPGSRASRIQLRRNESAESAGNALGDTAGLVAHAAVHADPHGDAGDLVLGDAVRRCFDLEYRPRPPKGLSKQALKQGVSYPRWWNLHVHQLFDEQRLAQVNAGDGLVLGGGGLFRPDSAPNGNSGWQWNISDEMLRRITVPLVVWGVGHHTSAGREFDGDRFGASLRTLVGSSAFVGLRHRDSVERVRDLLPGELADRVVWQPCPTTVLSRLTGTTRASAQTSPQENAGDLGEAGPVLLNCAPDRSGEGYGQFLAGMRDWILETRQRAEVRYVAHTVDDESFVVDLRREHGLSLPVIPLYDLPVDRIHLLHRRAALVVGMRGHAATIPFGCGTPFVSLISRSEPGHFLHDIDRSGWGVPVGDPALGGRLGELTGHLLDTRTAVVNDVARLQQRLFEVTLNNLEGLPEPLRVARRG